MVWDITSRAADGLQISEDLIVQWLYLPDFQLCDQRFKQKQESDYEQHQSPRSPSYSQQYWGIG